LPEQVTRAYIYGSGFVQQSIYQDLHVSYLNTLRLKPTENTKVRGTKITKINN